MNTPTLPLLLALALLAGPAAAQAPAPPPARLGVRAGLNVARLVSPTAPGLYQWQRGPLAGVLLNVPFALHFAVQPEVLYSRKGGADLPALYHAGGTYQAATVSEALHYLDVPLLLSARLGPLRLEAGPQASWLLQATSTLRAGSVAEDSDSRYLYEGFDVGYVLGVGAEVQRHLQLGLRYTGGLGSTRTLGPELRNQTFQVQAAYLFRLDQHY